MEPHSWFLKVEIFWTGITAPPSCSWGYDSGPRLETFEQSERSSKATCSYVVVTVELQENMA